MDQILITISATVFLAWAGWISLFTIKTNEKANKSLANDEANRKEIEDIATRLETIASELKSSFSRLEGRLDLFLKNELDALKQIAQK